MVLEKCNNKIVMICLFILILYIVCTLYFYSKDGDLNNTIRGINKLKDINDKDEIINTLYRMVITQNVSVRWPAIVALSIVSSLFITYCTNGNLTVDQRFLITIPFVFVPMYLLFNFKKAHNCNENIVNATFLYSKNNK
jgi:hypothetical protein